ncbi:MAG: phosphodiester glycosidase family protein [Bacteroidota bacterium]
MKNLAFILLFLPFLSCSQQSDTIIIKPISTDSIKISWTNLAKGLDFCETDAPYKSIINDSKITVLKLEPQFFDFSLLIATELKTKSLTADKWADSFDLDIVINAGMYDLAKKMMSKGYLQNNKHVNNPNIHPNYNSMIAFNPKDSSLAKFSVLDLECTPWEKVKKDYNSYAQGLRMLDCDGKAIGWNKRKQSCSMLITAHDEKGFLYFIFCRSPYTHNEMIAFMQKFPFKLVNAIYMEGGPQTSLYVNIGDTKMEKIGSYVSETYPNDKNDHFWKLPNVIGVKLKK